MPEDNVPGFAMGIDGRLLVDAFAGWLVVRGRIPEILRCKGGIQRDVAARPHHEAAATRRHVVDITNDAQMEGVSIAVAAEWSRRMVAVGQGAVNAADAFGMEEFSGSQHLLGHGPDGGVGGQEPHHPLFATRFAKVPAEAAAGVGTCGVFLALCERADPGGGVVARAAGWRAVPQPATGPFQQLGVEDTAHDQVAVALEKAHFVRG